MSKAHTDLRLPSTYRVYKSVTGLLRVDETFHHNRNVELVKMGTPSLGMVSVYAIRVPGSSWVEIPGKEWTALANAIVNDTIHPLPISL